MFRRSMSRHRILGVAAATVAALALTACAGDDAGASSSGSTADGGDPIIIGLDEDSTGPGASYATIAGDTVRMAVDEINADGGILGREVRIVVGNDESDPTKTPSIVRKLVDDGAHAIILATGGGSVLQAKAVAKQAGITAVAPVAITTSVGLPPDNEFTYMLANGLDDYASVYCGAFEEMGYEKLAILADTTPAIDNIAGLLVPGLEECIDIVAEESAPVDAADLGAQTARIKQADPDVVLVMSVGGNFEVLAHNTLDPQLPDVLRFSLASIGNQPDAWDRANPGALAEVVYMGSIDTKNAATAALEEKLKKANGDDYRLTAYDAQAYDTVHLLKAAIEEAGGTEDLTAIRDAFDAISAYPAAFGQDGFTLSFSPDKHIGADSLCGLVLSGFDEDNQPSGAWPEYQVTC
ncbi:ABC transporter substrate-binding protein [Streptomyces sp. MS2A]|nr:ABC transporter substrate-binding protein [Microbacterium resistens]MDA4890651.1 ABC transporter substrate-binding protein [Streptomyces sp. MS2A]